MMIWGTAIIGMPTVLLALGPSPLSLLAFMLIGAMGESLWQPRFFAVRGKLRQKEKPACTWASRSCHGF